MHPLDALEEYRWRIAQYPGGPKLHLGLANILRVLSRPGQALEEYQFAYELAPEDVEIVLTLAMAEHDFANREAARQLYEKVLAMELTDSRELLGSLELSENSAAALGGLDALKRGRPSPWDYPIYNSEGKSLSDAMRSSSGGQAPGKGTRKRRK